MSRDIKVAESARSAYIGGLLKAFGSNKSTKYEEEVSRNKYDSIWKIKPPTIKEFFSKWFPEPLFPLQLEIAEKACGINPLVWNTDYDEIHCYWGKGAGKDRTIAKMLVYIVVKLLCMDDPQKGLSKYLGEGAIGLDSPIDIINVSKDRDQARDVFFKNFKSILKRTINPTTGKNFFLEQGVDIREGKDLQTQYVVFPSGITCHSLNSKQYTGEGLNLFWAVADEIGASPAATVRSQLISIRETLDSRFPKIGKLVLMSYKYGANCPMTIEYKKGLNDPRVFSSNAATWEVNPRKPKQNFLRHYQRNPEKAQWTYECKDTGDVGGGFIKQKFVIPWCFRKEMGENPFVNNIVRTDNIVNLQFKDWFWKKMEGKYCAIHVDLAKGKIATGGDCVGIAMVHPEMMVPNPHPQSIEKLKELGFIIDGNANKDERKGVVLDFALQIFAPSGYEVQFSEIANLILYVRKQGVNIYKVTFDGWNSLGEIQRLIQSGILSEELSVDKTTAPYDSIKNLFYAGLFRGYEHSVAIREFKELIKVEQGKVDHPESSWERLETEGTEEGSKDVADSITASSFIAIKEIPLTSGICF